MWELVLLEARGLRGRSMAVKVKDTAKPPPRVSLPPGCRPSITHAGLSRVMSNEFQQSASNGTLSPTPN